MTTTPTARMARLRRAAINDHDCPHCHVLAGQHCESEVPFLSAVVHDSRLDLAHKAAVDRSAAWGLREGRKQALAEAQAALAGIPLRPDVVLRPDE